MVLWSWYAITVLAFAVTKDYYAEMEGTKRLL